MTLNAEEHPLSVDVRNGEVVMTGPRVAIALQPAAATEGLGFNYEREEEKEIDANAVFAKLSALKSKNTDNDDE